MGGGVSGGCGVSGEGWGCFNRAGFCRVSYVGSQGAVPEGWLHHGPGIFRVRSLGVVEEGACWDGIVWGLVGVGCGGGMGID